MTHVTQKTPFSALVLNFLQQTYIPKQVDCIFLASCSSGKNKIGNQWNAKSMHYFCWSREVFSYIYCIIAFSNIQSKTFRFRYQNYHRIKFFFAKLKEIIKWNTSFLGPLLKQSNLRLKKYEMHQRVVE